MTSFATHRRHAAAALQPRAPPIISRSMSGPTHGTCPPMYSTPTSAASAASGALRKGASLLRSLSAMPRRATSMSGLDFELTPPGTLPDASLTPNSEVPPSPRTHVSSADIRHREAAALRSDRAAAEHEFGRYIAEGTIDEDSEEGQSLDLILHWEVSHQSAPFRLSAYDP